MGNDLIFTLDECSECNGRFGDTIEQSLITFLLPMRAISGLTGYKSSTKIKGRNGAQIVIQDNEAHFFVEFVDQEKGIPPKQVIFETNDGICAQDIYRTLCKAALGITNNDRLEFFKSTIEWINKKFDATILPNVASMIAPPHALSEDYKQPEIATFYRVNDAPECARWPRLVAQVRLASAIFIFIVPTFTICEDESIHCNEEFDLFWELFPFKKYPTWTFTNFILAEPKRALFTINLEQRQREETT